jgi:hypothetical protein
MFGFRYILANPRQVSLDHIPLLNKAYQSWEETFRPIIEGAGAKFDADDFAKAEVVGLLMDQDQIVGSHCYSVYDLRLQACRNLHFFKELTTKTVDNLIQRQNSCVITLEYTNIQQAYRKTTVKGGSQIPWLDILTGLGLLYLDNSAADGIIGTPRRDRKVDQMTLRLNAYEIQESIYKVNHECAVVYFPKQNHRQIIDEKTNQWVQRLWKTRVDLSKETSDIKIKKSA